MYEYRHLERGYHIDYCFASKNWIDKINHVMVGKYDDWYELSDHCPIIVDFKE